MPVPVLIAAMQRIRRTLSRLLSFVLACLVLVWAGAACAEEAYDSATELVEQVQVDQFTALDSGADEPGDCPAFVSDFALPEPFLIEHRPDGVRPVFRSILPLPASPPPRRG